VLEESDLFVSGTNGYHTYRIPALVVTTEGTVLAFCEARRNSRHDDGEIDLMLRRSTDGGRTWSDGQVIADDGDHTMGNPCPVVNQGDGTVWLPFCRDNRRVFVINSKDDGRTWSAPAEITNNVMAPGWPWIGTGPGHGIQLQNGRLVIPSWTGKGPHVSRQTIERSVVIYSDDDGLNWRQSAPFGEDESNECEAVELVDGSLYMNMRSLPERHQRSFSLSRDGGQSWSKVGYDAALPEPSCQASIVRFTATTYSDKNRVLVAGPANPDARACLTVRISYDECRTWPASKILYPGAAAYSDLTVADDGQLLCLYEADEYARLVLARFDIEWLTDGTDSLQQPKMAASRI
jgi:sialidase-1